MQVGLDTPPQEDGSMERGVDSATVCVGIDVLTDTLRSFEVQPVYWMADRRGGRGHAWQRPGLGRRVRVKALRGHCAEQHQRCYDPTSQALDRWAARYRMSRSSARRHSRCLDRPLVKSVGGDDQLKAGTLKRGDQLRRAKRPKPDVWV